MTDAAANPARLLGRTEVIVRWGDQDAYNHVNNGVYMRYLEEARLEWMLRIPDAADASRSRALMAACEIQYRRPIEWPATVVIEMFCERIGNTSATLGYRLLTWPQGACAEPIVHADCRTVMVWTDSQSGRPIPLPEAVRASLEAAVGP